MKTKTIKNINGLLLILLLCMTASAGTFLIFEDNKIGLFGHGMTSGKADAVWGLETGVDKETQADVEVNNENLVSGVAVAEKSSSEQQQQKEEIVQASQDQSDKEGNFSFLAIGDADSRSDANGFSANLDYALGRAKDHNPDFALFTGDILRVGNGDAKQSENKIEALKYLIQKYYNNYYFAFGNHDIECGNECIGFWQKVFFGQEEKQEKYKLYHSFDYQNTHFVLLSTDYPQRYGVDDDQMKWLEEDLANSKKVNKIIVQHVPPIAFFKESDNKCHDMTCNETQRQKLLEIYKKNGVDLVISGNENSFDHQIVDGIDFVLSGSIGNESGHKGAVKGDIYVLCSIDGEEISLEGMSTKGEVIRKIEIK